jgi:hypothetical protein
MEFYSARTKNETMCFKGKWMQLEDIMLSKVSQAQKDKGHKYKLHYEKQIALRGGH